MPIKRRDYRLEVSKMHVGMGDTGSDVVNPLILALRTRYPDAKEIQLMEGGIIIEFPTTVMTFLMSEDTLDFYHAMMADAPLKPRSLHLWRAVLTGGIIGEHDHIFDNAAPNN